MGRISRRLGVLLALALVAGCTSGRAPSSAPGSQPPASAGQLAGHATVLVEHLGVPWGVAFLPDGSALVTERESHQVLRVAANGSVRPIGTIAGVAPNAGEGGLLGVALSPRYASDHLVYFYLTSATDNRIVSYTFAGNALSDPRAVFTGLPKAVVHNGGRIAFGPDGDLYVTVGDATQSDRAPDWDYLGGKVLRMTPAGKPAQGNPRANSVVYTVGHRNPQGLAWGPDGTLYEAEFGQNSEDEINVLKPGRDYGWPTDEGKLGPSRPGLTRPIATWQTRDASPSGLAYLDGALWLGTLQGKRIYRIALSAPGKPGAITALLSGRYGRLRTVAAAPDGSLWVTTSNRDGRGDPVGSDDRIIRVT